MSDEDPASELGTHGRFVRRLAGDMLGLGREADDLAQDAMLAAIRTGAVGRVPRPAMRAWLTQTLRRLVSSDRRQTSARDAREAGHAEGREEAPTPHGLAVKKETVQKVYDAVMDLPEPYLSTVLLTYYEGLSAQQIAAEQNVPVATVRSQQQRAKDKLRARLQRELGGSDQALGLALLPLVSKQPGSGLVAVPATAAGATSLSSSLVAGAILTGWKWLSLAAALGLLAWVGLREFAGPPEPAEPALVQPLDPDSAAAGAPPSGLPEDANPAADPRRVADLGANIPLAPNPGPATAPTLGPVPDHKAGLFGRVLHQGAPLAGVLVTQSRPEIALMKDAQGTVLPGELDIDPDTREALVAAQLGYSAMRPQSIDPVRDGSPTGQFLLPESQSDAPPVTTDADGWFHFPAMPEDPYILTLQHFDRDLALRDRPRLPVAGPRANLGDLELAPSATLRGTLAGNRSLRLDGHKVRIKGLRSLSATTDQSGEFAFSTLPAGDVLLDVRPSEGLYLTSNSEFFLRLAPGQDRQVKIELPAIACSIASIRVTCNGSPWAGGRVGFQHADSQFDVFVTLDDAGRGEATLPAQAPLSCVAQIGTTKITLGPDIVLKEGVSEVALQLEIGSVRVSVPTEHFPAPEACQLAFSIDSPDYSAVRFDVLLGEQGQPTPLDTGGRALVTVPAWTRLKPALFFQERVWIHVDTDRATFPAGDASFRMASDPKTGALRITDAPEPDATSEQPRPRRYRLLLTWKSASSGETQTLVRNLNSLQFVSTKDERQTFTFDFVPAGRRTFQVISQHRHWNKGSNIATWPLVIEVQPGALTEALVPGSGE